MEFIVFVITAAVSVAAAIAMVLQRHAMYSALFLVLVFFCLSVFYVLLGAYFLAVVQVAVYAGAIMVLMLFVLMLLNVARPESTDRRLASLRPFAVLAGIILIVELVAAVVSSSAAPSAAAPAASGTTTLAATPTVAVRATATPVTYELAGAVPVGHTQLLAAVLFTRYLFPFEVTSILLLGAILGASVLARKRPQLT
jgi:NADH-quinone oxidoreductase subunit J